MTTFAPHPYVKNVAAAIDFYRAAFGAVEVFRKSNSDGSVHVVEMTLGGALFHVHEERADAGQLSPESLHATTSQFEVLADDPDALFDMAVSAGGTVISAMQDYDYGYRQGVLADPFGHQWLIEKKI
jgi:PhnB protein